MSAIQDPSSPRQSHRYVFDNAAAETTGRFRALESMYDETSIRHLAPLVTCGTRCLEVGGGSGSLALWMANRVGSDGHVVVTDINTAFLEHLDAPNLEVRRHDIVQDPIEESAYDLAHTRLVLVHLPQRLEVVSRLVSALKPGGWIVLQEFDSSSMKPDPAIGHAETALKTLAAMWDQMTSKGVDLGFGRQLFPLLRALGLQEVSAEGHVIFNQGGSAGASLLEANLNQLHDQLVDSGRVTEEEFMADLERLRDPDLMWPSSTLWTCWGQKPHVA